MYIRKPGDCSGYKVGISCFQLIKKKSILNKLNEAVSFENFLHTKYVGQNVFTGRWRIDNQPLIL
jgi:2-oxoglutarate dehydrogenase E1 component